MSEVDKKLIDAIKKLDLIKENKIKEIEKCEKEKLKYQSSMNEIIDDDTAEIYTKETVKLTEELDKQNEDLVSLQKLRDVFIKQNNVINNIINYSGDLNFFYRLIDSVKTDIDTEEFESFVIIGKNLGVKYPFQPRDKKEINDKSKEIEVMKLVIANNSHMLEHKKLIEDTKNKFKVIFNFYNRTVPFLEKSCTSLEKKIKENEKKLSDARNKEIDRKRKEIVDKINELDETINSCNQSINSIEKAYNLFDEYSNSHKKDDLIKLIEELCNLETLSTRASKKISYEPKEKEIEEEKTELEETKEQKEEIIYELDSDYFRRSSTKHIICFLGDKDNEILYDIDNHFDGKSKLAVLTEMENLFNFLYMHETNNDNYVETGGNPKYFSDKFAHALISSPLGFGYRRFGVSKDQYRIHAVVGYSDLLNELGYGSGNIVFFGAVGVNDTTKKSDAYHRIGSRAIESLSNGGGAPKLRKNFDYIEHIIKKQIPFDLLSEEDKNNKKMGNFNGKIKGTKTDKSYENMKYFYYDVLDDTSKRNVKKYLDDYFLKQTNSMFEILDERKKLKGDTLD